MKKITKKKKQFENLNDLPNRLREFRGSETQKAIGSVIGVTADAISKAERGNTSAIGIRKWLKLAEYFEVGFEELLGYKKNIVITLDAIVE